MPSRTRVQLGLPAVIPATDYSVGQRILDSVLPRYGALRQMFGLDQDIVTDPIYHIGDDGGKSSQFYRNSLLFSNQRLPIYTLVEEMDTYDLVNSALDLYAEESTQPDPDTQRVVWIESEDGAIRSELMDLMVRLNMDDRLFGIVRTMCKYGDNFERIVTADTLGVVRLSYVHPARLSRIEDKEGRLQGFAAGILPPEECEWEAHQDVQRISYPWDFVHFRLSSNNRDSKHGDSILLGCRRAYQQLKMTEDMLVLYRLARGMDRDVYYVNTGGATQSQAWRTMHEFRQEVRKRLAINPGQSMRQEYNMRTPDEDIFLPVNGKEDPTRVERQQGGQPQGDIEDIDHFRRKLFAALRIPAGFMGFESDTPAKATLASQDVRFARGIKRIQRAAKQGIRWICEVHLIKKGMPTRDELGRMQVKFSVRMAPVNQLEEQAKLEVYQARIELVTQMLALIGMQQQPDPTTGLIIPASGVIKNVEQWSAWVLRKFMMLSDAEVEIFLGDSSLGLTIDDMQARQLTELAEKNGTMLEKMKNSLATVKQLVEALREDDDDCFVVSPKIREGSARQAEYNLATEEKALAERLGHSGDGYLAPCPKCREKALAQKYDVLEGRNYLLCSCGYVSYEPDHG